MATIRLPPDFKEFLKLLNSNKVEYLLIGGYAVGYYGYPRPTGDMDIWIARTPDTRRGSLMPCGSLASPVQSNSFLDQKKVVRMGLPPFRLEI